MGMTTTTAPPQEAIRLRTSFSRDGFSYRQVWRDGDVAVFQYDSRGGSFEVVTIVVEPERVKFGKLTPAHEVYPTASQWGTYGWSFGPRDREIALSIAEALRKSPRSRRVRTARDTMARLWRQAVS
jgi:hypothetical protein